MENKKDATSVVIESTVDPLPVLVQPGKTDNTVKLAIIGGVVTIVVSAFTLLTSIKTQDKVKEVHHQINSRMDSLLRLTKEKYEAEGALRGKQEQVTSDSLEKVKDK